MQKNAETILEYFGDVREAGAQNTALRMADVGIGQISEITVAFDNKHVKEFTMVDKDGHAYYIVMDGDGFPMYIFKDKIKGELLFALPPE